MHKLCASRIIVNVTTIISRAKLRSLDQEPAQFHLGSSHSNFDLWSSCITTSNIQSLFACGTNTLPFLKTTCNREVPTPKYRHLQNPLFSIAGNFSTFARLVFITQVLNMSISHGKILSLWSNLQLHCEMDIQIESFDQKNSLVTKCTRTQLTKFCVKSESMQCVDMRHRKQLELTFVAYIVENLWCLAFCQQSTCFRPQAEKKVRPGIVCKISILNLSTWVLRFSPRMARYYGKHY